MKETCNGDVVCPTAPNINKAPSPCKDNSQKRNRPRPKPVYFWTNADVLKWFRRHCAEHHPAYGHFFGIHDITGRSLIRMHDVNLEKMGISDPNHRDEIWREILKLKLKSDILELRDLQNKIGSLSTN